MYITIALTASAAYIHYPAVNNATISLSATTSNKSITLKSANYTNHVNGVLFDNSLLYVYGSTLQATYPMVLGEGTNVISFTCNDTAGNTVTKWITIIYDNDNPKLLITSPADGSYNITGIMTLRWNGSDALSGIAYYNVSVFDGRSGPTTVAWPRPRTASSWTSYRAITPCTFWRSTRPETRPGRRWRSSSTRPRRRS